MASIYLCAKCIIRDLIEGFQSSGRGHDPIPYLKPDGKGCESNCTVGRGDGPGVIAGGSGGGGENVDPDALRAAGREGEGESVAGLVMIGIDCGQQDIGNEA